MPMPALAVRMAMLGASLNQSVVQEAVEPCLAVDGNHVPYAAWVESNGDTLGGYQVFVKRWTGTAWERLGAAVNVDINQRAQTPSVVLMQSEPFTPHIAWVESSTSNARVYVKKLDSGAWQSIGSALNAGGYSARQPALALQSNRLFAAWSENNGTANQVYVRYSDSGGPWSSAVSVNTHTAISASNPKLAVAPNNNVYLTWEAGGDIFVRRWNGSAWVQEGANLRLNVSSTAASPAIAVDNLNAPAVAWIEKAGGVDTLFVKTLTAGQWQSMGGSLNRDPAQNASAPTLSWNGKWHVGWAEGQKIYLSTWKPSAWVAEGGSQNIGPANLAQSPSLAALRAELFLTWAENNDLGHMQIFAVQWPHAPAHPSLVSAEAGISGAFPVFRLSSTNEYNHTLQFRIQISNSSGFTTVVKDLDQTQAGANWDAISYASGATAVGTLRIADGALDSGVKYWRAAAYDTVYDIWSEIESAPSAAYTVPAFAYTAPLVSSATHTSPLAWYPQRSAALSWEVPPQASTFAYRVDQSSVTRPDPGGLTVTGNYLLTDLPTDGVWYFHLLYKDSAGNSSDTAHFALRVDTQAPMIDTVSVQPLAETKCRISWAARDSGEISQMAGVAGYSYVFDRHFSTDPGTVRQVASEIIGADLEAESIGLWYFHIRACDAAGNWSPVRTQAVKMQCPLLPQNQVRGVPNPVRQGPARIRFFVSEAANVSMRIMTASERMVIHRDINCGAEGTYTEEWSIDGVPNGVYLCRLTAKSRAGGEVSSAVCKLVIAR